MSRRVHGDLEILHPAPLNLVHPAMHANELRIPADLRVLAPRGLDDVCREHIAHLLLDVLVDELLGRRLLERLREARERPEPVLQRRFGRGGGWRRRGGRGEARCGATALRVTYNDDVLDAEVGDGVGEDGEYVLVVQMHLATFTMTCQHSVGETRTRRTDSLCDVTMHEYLAWLASEDHALGDTRVRAADPEDLCTRNIDRTR